MLAYTFFVTYNNIHTCIQNLSYVYDIARRRKKQNNKISKNVINLC
jgi:hypothetical protein